MNRPVFIAALAATLISALSLLPVTQASAKPPNVFVGTVDHVSSENIKVTGGGQSLSFLLVPRFDQVFSGDGKTTRQMAEIHNGDYVKIFYDQKMMGARHADKIFIMKSNGHAMSGQKS